jgi:hypothetical protein
MLDLARRRGREPALGSTGRPKSRERPKGDLDRLVHWRDGASERTPFLRSVRARTEVPAEAGHLVGGGDFTKRGRNPTGRSQTFDKCLMYYIIRDGLLHAETKHRKWFAVF